MKTIHKLLPKELVHLFQKAIRDEYENKVYDKPRPCPYCGNRKAWKYDKIRKIFCRLITQKGLEDIKVMVVRHQCSKCRKAFYPETPFYLNCDFGNPIVDFCLFLAAGNPFNRVERIMAEHGLQVDRKTVANYAVRFKDRLKKYSGIKLSGKAIGINFLKMFFGVSNVEELRKRHPDKKYDSVSDETYPPKRGAEQTLAEENRLRRYFKLDEKKYPDGFTLAVGYLPSIRAYVSLILTENPFNSMFARLLGMPLDGTDYNLTDGHKAYEQWTNHERCLFHKSRNLAKRDKVLKELEKSKLPDDVKQYLKERYAKLKEEYMRYMKERYPWMVSDNNFTGALTTNAIEGGNWRIKFELRTSYKNIDSIETRAALICIMDSMYCFRYGKAMESFVHANSQFAFEGVMSVALEKEKEVPVLHSKYNPLYIRRQQEVKWHVI